MARRGKMREKIEDVLRDFRLTVGMIRRESPETTDSFLSVLRSVHREGALSFGQYFSL